MNKAKLFISNILIYGLGGIITKAIPLIMLPIITRLMPSTEYFGISDMSNTIISLCSALAVMGMYDAMYRMFFEKDEEKYKKDICSTAFIFTMCTSLLIFAVMLLSKDFIAEQFFANKEYAYLVYISAIATLVGATNSIVSAPTRMQDKKWTFLIANTLSPILSYSIAIPLLLNGYYILALPLAGMIAVITMELVFVIINHKWFSFKGFNFKYLKQLLVIAIPLLPNFLIYWVFGSCDKLMITNILGMEATGIYSVGAKLGQASQLIYLAFAGGWQFFAFSTMKEKNQVKTNSSIFEYLGLISFVAGMFICALSKPIFELLFTGDYLSGWIISPYLFMAPLLQMLFQVAANQFLVVKKTWPNLLILSSGAVINIVINIFLIPILGIEGAALATMLGYVVSDIICVIVLCKMKLMVISWRFIISALSMAGFMVAWRLLFSEIIWIGVLVALALSIILCLLYIKDIKKLVNSLLHTKKNREGVSQVTTNDTTTAENDTEKDLSSGDTEDES